MTIHQWLEAYGESHKNSLNKTIHWICVPIIFFSIVAMFSLIPVPTPFGLNLNLAELSLIFASLFYIRLSWKLALGAIVFAGICLGISLSLQSNGYPVFSIALSLFIAAWIGQFYGHHVEGKKPSFLKDIQFLLIGPIWLLADFYKKWKINY
ncbi:MAG: hypothetical protein CFE21_07610 [Bacteroidetes bacterium B1(2017)]|nr:MAG: hypothetical protein CFE21_07610 [Bacteroidetes bacterium B1(2017)]